MKKSGLIFIIIIALTLFGFIFLCMPALAQTAPAAPGTEDKESKYKDIRELLTVIKIDESLGQIINIMLNNLEKELLLVTDKDEAETIKNKIKNKFKIEDVIQLVIPIYDKYLSVNDVKGLIAFYKTPLGQKIITITPVMTAESINAGAEYGEKIAKEIIQEMKQEKIKQDAGKPKPPDGKKQ